MICPAPRDRVGAALRALGTFVLSGLLAASAPGCSGNDAEDRDTRGRDSGAQHEDAGAVGPFKGRCGDQRCPKSGIDTVGCCTHPGTGEPGHLLENTGRAPDLCGTDVGTVFSALDGICIQLDQPGGIDRECPAQEQLGGGVIMPGCCTDEGYCGSLETVAGFGCFYATGRKGRPCRPDADADAGP